MLADPDTFEPRICPRHKTRLLRRPTGNPFLPLSPTAGAFLTTNQDTGTPKVEGIQTRASQTLQLQGNSDKVTSPAPGMYKPHFLWVCEDFHL